MFELCFILVVSVILGVGTTYLDDVVGRWFAKRRQAILEAAFAELDRREQALAEATNNSTIEPNSEEGEPPSLSSATTSDEGGKQ